MVKKLTVGLFVLLLLSSTVYAENTAPTRKTPEEIEAYKQEMRAEKQIMIQELKATGQAEKQGIINEVREEVREELGDEVNSVATTPAEIRLRLEERIREKLQLRQELLSQKREQFRERVQSIRDEVKQKILTRLDQKLNNLNKHLVEQLSAKLDRMGEIANQLEEQALGLEAQGANVTEITNTLLPAVREDMETLDADLETQAEKTYTPTITTENSLKTDVGKEHQALTSDIKALRDQMVNIKNQLVTIAKKLVTIKTELEVTPTPDGSADTAE